VSWGNTFPFCLHLLFSWHSWFCEALSASCFLFLTEASNSHILRHINNFFIVLPDAFSSRFFKTNVLHFSFLHVSSSFCFFCLARRSFKIFPNFRWDALWGIYSDVTLPYTFFWGLFSSPTLFAMWVWRSSRWEACAFFCKCAEVCELRMRYRDLFERMFKTLRVFAPSSSEFIPFLTCPHSITDFEINAFLNQDSYRLLKFVSDLVTIFDTGWFCFTSQLPSARDSGCRPSL